MDRGYLLFATGLWSRAALFGGICFPGLFALGVFALMPSLDATHGVRPELSVVRTSVHAALMAFSYGAFGLSSVAALVYLTQERNLRFHKLQAIFSLIPPIQRLETASGRLLLSWLLLLTPGLAIGVWNSHINNPQAYRGDPEGRLVGGGLAALLRADFYALDICAGRTAVCSRCHLQLCFCPVDFLGHQRPLARSITHEPHLCACRLASGD